MTHITVISKVAAVSACISSVIAAPAHQRSLSISIGGGVPGETQYHVRISEVTRSLKVTKESLPITEKARLTKTEGTVPLSAKALIRIFLLASRADDFSQSDQPAPDGLSAAMELEDGTGRRVYRECFSAPRWPIGAQTKALLAEIGRHLPAEMQDDWPK